MHMMDSTESQSREKDEHSSMDDRKYSEDRSTWPSWRTKRASLSGHGTGNDLRRHREVPSRSNLWDTDTSFEAPLPRGEDKVLEQHRSRSRESGWRDRHSSPSRASSFESDASECLPSSPRHHEYHEPRRKEPAAVGASVSSRSGGKGSSGGSEGRRHADRQSGQRPVSLQPRAEAGAGKEEYHRPPQKSETSLGNVERRQRDPRLAHKADLQRQRHDADPGRPRRPQHGKSHAQSKTLLSRSREDPPRAAELSVTVPPPAGRAAEGAASSVSSRRPSPASAPADPRRRRLRTSARASGAAAVAAAPASPPTKKSLSRDAALGGRDASASPRSNDGGIRHGVGSETPANVSGVIGGAGTGTFASIAVARGRISPDRPWLERDKARSSGSTRHAGSRHGERGGAGSRESEFQEAKREPRPAETRFVRHSSDPGGRDSPVHSAHSDRPARSEYAEDDMRRGRGDSDSRVRWDDDTMGIKGPLAVSIQGVTLGGRGARRPGRSMPRRDDPGGVHIRLPLRGQKHPRTPQASLLRRESRSPVQDDDRHRPQQFRHAPPLSQDPGVTGDLRPDFGHVNSTSPPPTQRPWMNSHQSADSFDKRRSTVGGGDKGVGHGVQHHGRPPLNDFPPGDVGPRPGGSHRRSAYAQAMHNKRFMGSAAGMAEGEGEGHGRGIGPPVGGTGTLAVGGGFAPPRRPTPLHGPYQRHSTHDHSSRPLFQGSYGRWDDEDAGIDSGGGGGSSDQDLRLGPLGGGNWSSLGSDGRDEVSFPITHTSPEWTPAGVVAPGSLEAGMPCDPPWAHPTSPYGETRAELFKGGGAMTAKGQGKSGSYRRTGTSEPGEVSTDSGGRKPSTQAAAADQPTEAEAPVKGSLETEKVDMATAVASVDAAQTASAAAASPAAAGSTKAVVERRLKPTPLAKAAWSTGDLASRFPRLPIPESLTHVIASWTALDTRAIGVIPMLCQPIANKARDEVGASGQSGGARIARSKRKRVEDGKYSVSGGGDGAGEAPVHAWEARVLVPFGLIPEQAAKGCWAEALRLVVAPAIAIESAPDPNAAHDVDGNGTDAKRAAETLTLPGGLWDAELDGGDPATDDNRALIATAVRSSKITGGVDLARCSSWLKFCEVHEDDRSTVVFLCGGGVRVAEGSPGDIHAATISELINGSVSFGNKSDGNRCHGLDATFEAKLGAEFLWGLVSRDWAGVVFDSLRLQAAALDKNAEDGSVTASGNGDAHPAKRSAYKKEPPPGGKRGEPFAGGWSMAETPAEVRAAFGLFDAEGTGCVAGDRLEAYLVEAGFRLSNRYLKSLLRSLCRVAEDGKRLFFEYRRRLAGVEEAGREELVKGNTAIPNPLSVEAPFEGTALATMDVDNSSNVSDNTKDSN